MAASRSMLESLLARVQQRAAEPRQPALAASMLEPRVLEPRVLDPSPEASRSMSHPQALLEEEIEDYEDELIEIIDDSEVTSESSPEVRPFELSPSVPSVEMRRRIVPPSSRPAAGGYNPAPAAPAAEALRGAVARAVSNPVTGPREQLHAELVARKPLGGATVVQSHGSRREARALPFVELLDASLKLGS